MAALPPVPKTLQVQLIYSDGGDTDIRNILYFKYSGTASATDLVTLAQEVKTVWGTHMAGQHRSNLLLESVFIDDLNSDTGFQAVDGNPAVSGSNIASTSYTSGAAFVMSNVGQLKYRGGHSRTYLPSIPTSATADPNTWTTAYQAAMLSAWQGFIAAIISAAPTAIQLLGQVIAHRFGKSATAPVAGSLASSRSVPLTTPFTENVVAHRTNPQVGSQRRRNLQVG